MCCSKLLGAVGHKADADVAAAAPVAATAATAVIIDDAANDITVSIVRQLRCQWLQLAYSLSLILSKVLSRLQQ